MRPTFRRIALVSLVALCAGAAPARQEGAAADPLSGVSVQAMERKDAAYTQTLGDGRVATFTVDPALQGYADELFARYQVPAGAAVILNSRTGRVLALSSHISDERIAASPAVALDPSPPAASLFKLVTTAALLERGDERLDTRVCYHGGSQRLEMHHLVDSERDDTACASLSWALGHSTNAIFAKLSDRRLDRAVLGEYARRFGFNTALDSDIPVPVSRALIPEDRLERARTAAGFWNTHMSPLHAAVIAQTIAQKGAMLRPYVVDRITDADGRVVHRSGPSFVGRPITAQTAAALLDAMKGTVSGGTARKAFRDDRGSPLLPGVEVAGKTGTLNGRDPYRAYSWFVAVAPADKPEIALAVLIVNKPEWRIKSAPFAAMLLRKYFEARL
jgi:cell division protein FtsI/penicillin-binding protein 2